MRRVIMLISVCALLWGCLLTGAHAQQVSIANDNNLLDISLRDADLSTVLTALFNSTGGKYRLQLSNGVNGRIARLQLTQTPFDRALDAILGTDFSYTKQMQGDGAYLYTISGRSSLSTTRMPSVFQAPPIGMPSYGGAAPAAPSGFMTPAGGASPAGSSGLLSLGFGATGATTTGDAAASESSVVKMIRVNYLDVGLLAETLGGTSVDLFELLQSANGDYGGGSGGGRSGGSSRGGRNSNRNDNGYNNNNNNNNNYNNNNSNNRNSNRNSDRNSNRNSDRNSRNR